MTRFTRFLGAATLAGALAAPAAAQYYPSQPYPQTYPQYPQYPQQQYPQTYPNYGYQQGYTGNPVTDVIDQLLGNRYNVTDRQAVRQCAAAAASQAQGQYGNGYGGYGAYNQQYGYNNQYGYHGFQVTSITNVERRSYGLRVSGVLSSGHGGYANQSYNYGQNYGYNHAMQLTFRCNVDYRGSVTDVHVRPYNAYHGY